LCLLKNSWTSFHFPLKEITLENGIAGIFDCLSYLDIFTEISTAPEGIERKPLLGECSHSSFLAVY